MRPPKNPAHYAIRTHARGYRIVKFAYDGEPVTYHTISIVSERGAQKYSCDCPWNVPGYDCKHMDMVHLFKKMYAINSGRRYVYDTDTWLPPLVRMEM